MKKLLEQEIFTLQWKIENLTEQEKTTRAACIAEYEIKKRDPNCKAMLGIAWHCLERAEEASKENNIPLASFYISHTNRAVGMAEAEFSRLFTLRKNQAKASEMRQKYSKGQIDAWRQYACQINPDGTLSDSEVSKLIIEYFNLPSSSDRSIREKIRK